MTEQELYEHCKRQVSTNMDNNGEHKLVLALLKELKYFRAYGKGGLSVNSMFMDEVSFIPKEIKVPKEIVNSVIQSDYPLEIEDKVKELLGTKNEK